MAIGTSTRSDSLEAPSASPKTQTKDNITAPGKISYRPLDNDASEIRLLHILPSTGNEPIRCELVHNCLDHASTSFIALSYSWGYVDVRHTIYIDNTLCLVSKSVLDALQTLRSQPVLDQYDRNVWIDAVCINQADLLEKTKQVRMMSRIYSEATVVIAWLGAMTPAEKRGYALIDQTISGLQLVNEYELEGASTAVPESDTASLAASIGLPYIRHKAWHDVQAVFSKPWFSRVWIIQECILAKKFCFLYDTGLISPEPIFIFCSSFLKYPWLQEVMSYGSDPTPDGTTKPYTNPSHLWKAPTGITEWRNYYRRGERWPMPVCMFRGAIYQATDPRDRIFAMVSLCSDTDESIIDYKAELKDVLIKVSIDYILRERKNGCQGILDLLSAVQELQRIPGVPSWVLCGSQATTSLMALHHRFSVGSSLNYFAPNSRNREIVGETVPVLCMDPEHGSLLVSARRIDRIATIFDRSSMIPTVAPGMPVRESLLFSNPEFTPWQLESSARGLEAFSSPFKEARQLCELLKSYPNSCAVEECFWRSRFLDDQHELSDGQLGLHIEAYLKLTEQIIPRMIELAKVRGAREADPEYDQKRTLADLLNEWEWEKLCDKHDETFLALKSAIHPFELFINKNRSLAVTEHGLIAWVSDPIKVGDKIMIVDGTRIPIVLRQADPTGKPWAEEDWAEVPQFGKVTFEESWEVVGDVYLHGFMTGPVNEALASIADQVGPRSMIRIV